MADAHKTTRSTDKHNMNANDRLRDIAPIKGQVVITPSNTTVLSGIRAIAWQTDGTATIETDDGVAVTYTRFAGEYIPIDARKVKATGTTATVVGWK